MPSDGAEATEAPTARAPRLSVPEDADLRARRALLSACGLCGGELRTRAPRLRAALRALDLPTAQAEARHMGELAANFHLVGLLAPLARLERAARDSNLRAAFAALGQVEERLEAELAALPA